MKTRLLFLVVALCATHINAQTFNEVQKLTALDRGANDSYGYSVAIDGNYAIVGAWLEDQDATGGNTLAEAGSAYIYEKSGNGNWVEVQKIVAADRDVGDSFGLDVDIHGNFAVVGAYTEDEDVAGGNSLNNSGSAYIFERDSGGTWSQVQKIVASDRTAVDGFGLSVAMHEDVIIVGSYNGYDENGQNPGYITGAAYIFDYNGNSWSQTQKIVASYRDYGAKFGCDVDISGNYAVVGAYWDRTDENNANVMNRSGSVFIFEKNGGNWSEVRKFTPQYRGSIDELGWDVTIDGTTIAAGARFQQTDGAGQNPIAGAGAVYILDRDGSGTWNFTKKIVPNVRASNNFGDAVSISGDYLAVGNRLNDTDENNGNPLTYAGAAYIFARNTGGANNWGQKQKIVASDRNGNDRFGLEVGLDDGQLIIGSPHQDRDASGNNQMTDAGAAYISADPLLDINETIFTTVITAFPNPSNGQFTIDLGKEYTNVTVQITSMLGQIISSEKFDSAKNIKQEINASQGMYFVSISTATGESAIVKVLKR